MQDELISSIQRDQKNNFYNKSIQTHLAQSFLQTRMLHTQHLTIRQPKLLAQE